MPSPFIWRIQLFGVLRVTSGERTITRFRTQMTGSLLAYLAYHKGQPQSREVLIEQFWPDSDPKSGRSRLSLALTSLRAQLSLPDSGVPLFYADSFTVGLSPVVFETDVGDFQDAAKRAAYASGPSERMIALERATAYYTDDFLAGRYESWIVPEQERLRDEFLKASAQLIRLQEKARQGERALALARRVTRVAPLHETAWCDLIRLLVDTGEPNEALRVTQDAREAFEREGLNVPEAIVRLARAIHSPAHRSISPEESAPPMTETPHAAPSVPTLNSGTFTLLLAEGEAGALAALATTGQQEGGRLIAGEQGTLCLAFGDGHRAVSTALSGMRDAQGTLRIALDTGFVASNADGEKGEPLRTLPFLVAAAHTGQIICTEATAALTWHTLERPRVGHRLRDLGRYRFEVNETPRRVSQAEAIDFPPVLFPPLRARQGDTPTLPPTYTRFFGRQRDLARLTDLLTETAGKTEPTTAPLITLVGIGGMGKTRLSIEVAARAQTFFQGRVWFAALAELQTAAHIPEVIRNALRLPKDSSVDAIEQITDYLTIAPSLLILDNMEQFVANGDAARLVRSLRERVPSLACLITSRQMIGVEGEHAFLVKPLSHAPKWSSEAAWDTGDENASSALFVDRARAVRPDFAVTAANSEALVRLCALLEGIPLAIELAAARSGLLTPAQMLTQMEGRFALLQSRRWDMPARHRSLWAAIDSSYQYLPPNVQRFFARLAVFRGGWTLQSAQSIGCPSTAETDYGASQLLPPDVATLETLAELQESSLISMVGSGDSIAPRFQMLDTVRAFALEQLREREDEAATAQRHLVFFADLATKAEPHLTSGGTAQQEWLDILDAEQDNLRVALEAADNPATVLNMAIALHRYWLTRGHAAEGRRRLEAALAVALKAGSAPLTYQGKAHNALGVLAWASGALMEAEIHFVQSLETYRKADAPDKNPDCARALNNIGIVASQNGNFDLARTSYEESLRIYRTLGDALRQSMVLTNLGGVLLYLKDYAAARRVLEESLPIQRVAADDFSVLRTLQNLAEVALYQRDIGAAADALRESIAMRRALGDRSSLWDTLSTAAVILGEKNKNTEAAMLWGAAHGLMAGDNIQVAPANAEVEAVWAKRLRESLHDAAFEELYAKGHTMDFEQSLAFAGENV